MPTRNVDLTDHYDSFNDTSIASDRFSSASETVRAGLRLLERQEAEDQAKIEWLRATTTEAFGGVRLRRRRSANVRRRHRRLGEHCH